MKDFVKVDGVNVAFHIDGAGPGLMLLHGTGGDSETNWNEVAALLSARYTVIRPDYAGSGATADDGRALSMPMLAAQVMAAAERAGVFPLHLVGFSLGGSLATYVAAEFPHLVRSLVVLSGWAGSTDPRQALQFELWLDLIRTDRRAMARLLLLTGLRPDFLARMDAAQVRTIIDQIIENNNWEGMARQVDLDIALDVRDQARRVTQPALVIGCTHDQMVPPALAHALATLIPGARYEEIDTGHLSTLERPDEVARLIHEFVDAIGRQAR